MSQRCFFWDKIGHVMSFLVLLGYLTKWEISRDHFDFFDLFFNLFKEERIIILIFPRFEPTHLCDPSDQRGDSLAVCATSSQQGNLRFWKIAMKLCTSFATRLGTQVSDFSTCFNYFTKLDHNDFQISWDHFDFNLFEE